MRRVAVLMCIVLAGAVTAAGAVAATSSEPVEVHHLRPAATSVDHAPHCIIPAASTLSGTPTAGGTLVTFVLVPPGCD